MWTAARSAIRGSLPNCAHSYLLFPGEQHGFRRAENIRAALDGELSFYAQAWGFDLPTEEHIPPIDVVGLTT